MNFPLTSSLSIFFNIPWFLCLYLIIQYIRWLTAVYILHVEPPCFGKQMMKSPEVHVLLILIGASFLVGYSQFSFFWSSLSTQRAFQELRPESIRFIVIKRLAEENTFTGGETARIENPALIAGFFGSVHDAYSYSRSHEHFLDGYLIHLVKKVPQAGEDCYISVYRKTMPSGRRVEIAVPHLGSENLRAGGVELTCRPLLEWVEQNIDPLFKKEKP